MPSGKKNVAMAAAAHCGCEERCLESFDSMLSSLVDDFEKLHQHLWEIQAQLCVLTESKTNVYDEVYLIHKKLLHQLSDVLFRLYSANER